MATKLFLRNTTTNGVTGTGNFYDLSTTAGAAADSNYIVSTVDSATELQIERLGAGAVANWVTGWATTAFTLTTTDLSVWARETNAMANAGMRARIFKLEPNGTETELGGGPFDDGVELTTTLSEMVWTANVTDTAFAIGDRIVLRLYATNVGTMNGGYSIPVEINAADTVQGDSFFNLNETVTFSLTRMCMGSPGALALAGAAPTVSVSDNKSMTPTVGALALTGVAPTVQVAAPPQEITPAVGAFTFAGVAPTLRTDFRFTPVVGALTLAGVAPSLFRQDSITPTVGALTFTGIAPAVSYGTLLTPVVGSIVMTGVAPTLLTDFRLTPVLGALTFTGVAPTLLTDFRLTPTLGGLVLTGQLASIASASSATPTAGAALLSGVAGTHVTDFRMTPARAVYGA